MNNEEIIERLFKYFGGSLAHIEQELKLSNGTLGKFRSGKIGLPRTLEPALIHKGLNTNYFLNGEGSPDLKNGHNDIKHIQESFEGRLIPFLDQKASAGPGKDLLDGDHGGRVIRVPDAISDIPGLCAIEVSGDSMYPTLSDGDVVVCDSGGWTGDGIYVLRTHESEFVKRVILTPEGYNVISDNSLYPPYNCKRDDTEVIGRVRCAVVRM